MAGRRLRRCRARARRPAARGRPARGRPDVLPHPARGARPVSRRLRPATTVRRMAAPVPSLDGRLCLVTGAASGIGRATARAAADRGARVVLTDVRAEDLDAVASELGPAAVLHRALDIADVDAVRALADDVHSEHGSLDVAMNIA